MPIEELFDREELRAFLIEDPVGNAYLLGDLDEAYMPMCRWFGHREDGQLDALVLLYDGLSMPVVLTVAGLVGDSTLERQRALDHLDQLLKEVAPTLPRRFWVHAWAHHRAVVDRHYATSSLVRVSRMGLERARRCHLVPRTPVRQLGHADTGSIMELYEHYPDHFFEPYQLESGLYFGIDDPESGALVAIAGIHVHSETYDVAAIGNLVVHPASRQRGYATDITARLLDEVFKTVSLVTLNVREDNLAAIKTYEKFGFGHHNVYFEGRVQQK
jgi:ribosomal protein S18 acetylase RimI-like enzyme